MASTKTIWQTKDGQRIRIKDMTDQHLINTIRFLHRKAEQHLQEEIDAAYSCLAGLRGDMATYYCEQDIDRMHGTTLEEFLSESVPAYDAMVNELEKRKLSLNAVKPNLSKPTK